MTAPLSTSTLRAATIERAALNKRHAALGVPTTTGGLGEAIVAAEHPDWQRMPPGTEGYDFVDTEGRRVQVKTWGSHNRTHDNIHVTVDRLIRIRLLPDGGWETMTDCLVPPESFANGATLVSFNRAGRARPPTAYRQRVSPAFGQAGDGKRAA
jgi:hypothetical protein